MVKIYFAASIRGGQADKDTYKLIVSELKKYGRVLTEHIVSDQTTSLGSKGSSYKIYAQDIKWLHSSDVLVAEVSQPSFGVGYEIAHAERTGKTVLCLYRIDSSHSLSAMIEGSPFCYVKSYHDVSEISSIITGFMSDEKAIQ